MKKQRPDIKIGTVLYRLSWYDTVFVVVGETSRSWLVHGVGKNPWEPSIKLPKAKLPERWTLSEETHNEWLFAIRYCTQIADAVRSATPQQLRAIADLIGWKPPEQSTAKDRVAEVLGR